MTKSAAAQMADENGVGKIKAWPQRTKSFYTDVRTELKKVSTASRKEVQATTMVVLITVALFGVYFWAVDMAINYGVGNLQRYFLR